MNNVMKTITIKDMKEIEISLMKIIHKICEENHLYYFLAYGSCIGAVRHGGFIPWDDDIDIIMPYPDYRKLLALLSSHTGRYQIISMDNDNQYKYPYAKFIDKGTILEESEINDSKISVYIDIFPLCGLPNNAIKRIIFFNIINCNEYFAIVARKKKVTGKSLKKRIIQYLLWPISNLLGTNWFNLFCVKRMGKYKYEDSRYVAVFPPNYGKKEIYKKSLFNERILMPFENSYFYIPKEYDTYLRQVYGDYRKLPPTEEQVTHHTYTVLIDEKYWDS